MDYLFIGLLLALAVLAYAIRELGNSHNRLLIQTRVYTSDRHNLEMKLIALCDPAAAQMAGFVTQNAGALGPLSEAEVRYFNEEREMDLQGRDD